MNDHLLAGLAENDTSRTPREVVHLPERVERQEERECRDSDDVEHHPADHVPLAPEDEHQCLKTVDRGNHDDGRRRNGLTLACDKVDEVDDL